MMPRPSVTLASVAHETIDARLRTRYAARLGTGRKINRSQRWNPVSHSLQQVRSPMDHLSGYAHRPFPFVLRYLRQRPISHLAILACVVGAVACSVGTQYGVKFLVDCL